MNENMRFELLAEIAGQNVYPYVKKMDKDFTSSSSYRILSYNMDDVREHSSGKAKALIYSYENINLTPKSVKDYFIMETALDYLALHSYPEYYLNPLAIDPNYRGIINSIGELVIDYKGKEKTINEIIMDDTDSANVKKSEVNQYLEYYLSDMNRIIDESMESVTAKKLREENSMGKRVREMLDSFFFVFVNVLLLLFVTWNFNDIRSFFLQLDYIRLTTYGVVLYPLTTALYDFFYVFYHSYRSKIQEPYRYAQRFLKRNSDVVYKDVRNEKERLYDYISGAINNRILLKNDITDFSKLSSSYIDFKAVQLVSKKERSTFFRTLKNLAWSFRLLEFVVLIFTLIVFFIDLGFSTII